MLLMIFKSGYSPVLRSKLVMLVSGFLSKDCFILSQYEPLLITRVLPVTSVWRALSTAKLPDPCNMETYELFFLDILSSFCLTLIKISINSFCLWNRSVLMAEFLILLSRLTGPGVNKVYG
jgi:hypothetical protein